MKSYLGPSRSLATKNSNNYTMSVKGVHWFDQEESSYGDRLDINQISDEININAPKNSAINSHENIPIYVYHHICALSSMGF